MQAILDCAFEYWSPQIGDPHFVGWVTTLLYFLAAMGSAYIYLQKPNGAAETLAPSTAWYWLCLALVLLALGVNKQLDIQTLFTNIGRCLAREQGWYDSRHEMQKLFIYTVLLIAAMFAVSFVLFGAHIVKANFISFAGILFLLLFVLIRASSFHHMDILISARLFGIRMNWVLELAGLFLILLDIVSKIHQARTARSTPA